MNNMPPATITSRDWTLCFMCQSNVKEPTMNPSTSVKLKGKPDRLLTCYKEVTANIRELHDMGELANSIFKPYRFTFL